MHWMMMTVMMINNVLEIFRIVNISALFLQLYVEASMHIHLNCWID